MIYQMVCIDVMHSVLCETETEVLYIHFQWMSVCRRLTLLTMHSYKEHAYPKLNTIVDMQVENEILNLVHSARC